MGGLQNADAHQQRGGDGDDRLDVVVDGDDRWTQRTLTYHREDVAEEGADAHDIGHFQPGLRGNRADKDGADVAEREGQQHERSPREHILVDGEGVIAD